MSKSHAGWNHSAELWVVVDAHRHEAGGCQGRQVALDVVVIDDDAGHSLVQSPDHQHKH